MDCRTCDTRDLQFAESVETGQCFACREKSPTHQPTNDSQRRKETPVFTGVLRYFPRATRAVARLSYKGDRKHNPGKAPGEPPTWTRSKSADHGDCIVRHQITFDQIDPENGEYHAVAVAWRALAQLELLLEKEGVE